MDDEQVEDDEHDYELYEELCYELTGEKYNYSAKAAIEQITTHLNGDSNKAELEVRDTRLLLALNSDREVGLC